MSCLIIKSFSFIIPADIERRSEVLVGIRHRLESAMMGNLPASPLSNLLTATYSAMLKTFDLVPPNLEGNGNDKENKIRSDLLDLLNRIPLSEVPRQFVAELITLCHKVLKTDAEDNGIIAQRILFDIHKHFKQALEEQTGPLFDWLIELLTLLPASMEKQLADADELVGQDMIKPLVPAKGSGKLASEVTVMVYFLMQSYPKRVHQYGPSLIPLMVSLITMPGPNPEVLSQAALKPYSELRLVQIKMLALLLPLSRSQHINELLADHHAALCNALLHMMRTAPSGYSMRKELLQCMRNMHSTPLKHSLQQRLDDFLDEEVLLGKEVGETLRQLAYVSLAELVAGSKAELNTNQLRRIVYLYTRNALNALNSFSLQSTSLRLLHSIMEVLFHKRIVDSASAEVNRELLSDILHCLVIKLDSLHQLVPRYLSELRIVEEARQQRKAVEAAMLEDATEAGKAAMKNHLQKLEQEVMQFSKEAVLEEAAREKEGRGLNVAQEVAMDVTGDAVNPLAEAADLPSKAGDEGKETSNLRHMVGQDVQVNIVPADVNKIFSGNDVRIAKADDALVFRISPQGVGNASLKEREIGELRTLLHTVISCLKNVLFIMVAYHTSRGLQVPLTFSIKPWSSKRSDVLAVSRILYYGLPAILFFSTPFPTNFDAREMLADIFTAITDGRDFADVFDRRMPFLYELMLANSWYIKFLRHLVEGEASRKTLSNRHAIVCILRYLVTSKLEKLDVRILVLP